jgi:hypothetical protein
MAFVRLVRDAAALAGDESRGNLSGCGKQERHCCVPIGLIGEGKIGDDPAGKHDGKP